MDPVFIYAITLSVIFVFLIRKWNGKSLNSYPPGFSGWPFIGETIQFAMLGSSKFISDRMKKYSPHVFKTHLFGEKMAIFCGAEGNKFLFKNNTKHLSTWLPPSFIKVFFPTESVVDSKVIAALMRTSLHDVVKSDSMKQYVMIMDEMARQHIQKEWAPYEQVQAFNLAKKYTFDLACRLFISIEDPSIIKKLADDFHCVTNGLFSLPVDLPGTAYNSAIKGGKIVQEELLKIITERRKEQTENQEISAGRLDLLSRMLLANHVHGQYYSDNEISNTIFGLLLASHDTTSSAIAFVLKHLAEHSHIYNQVLTEQMEIAKAKGPDDLLTMEDIERMKYSWNVLRESLRVTPPGEGTFRETLRDCTYEGFFIPKGWKIFWSVHTTHQDPKYFPDPKKFDPTRFEGHGPTPYSYVPFGGGIHMCPGKEYASIAVLVFMQNIVKRFKLEKVIANEKNVYHITLVPTMGLPLRLHPNRV